MEIEAYEWITCMYVYVDDCETSIVLLPQLQRSSTTASLGMLPTLLGTRSGSRRRITSGNGFVPPYLLFLYVGPS